MSELTLLIVLFIGGVLLAWTVALLAVLIVAVKLWHDDARGPRARPDRHAADADDFDAIVFEWPSEIERAAIRRDRRLDGAA